MKPGRVSEVDIGMYLQTIMLPLRAEGLHDCAQMVWSVYRGTVASAAEPGYRMS